MNLFKHNSTRLFRRLSTKYPHTTDKKFSLTHGRHNLQLHVHDRIIFYGSRRSYSPELECHIMSNFVIL